MKKLILFSITSLLFMFTLASVTHAFQNEPDGFGGLKWGDQLGEDMEYTGMNGSVEYYRRKNDEIYFANSLLSQKSYGFYEGRLMVVNMFFLTGEHKDIKITVLERIKTKLENDYGKPQYTNSFETGEDTWWVGERSLIWLRVDWIQGSENNEGIVRVDFISNVIRKEMDNKT